MGTTRGVHSFIPCYCNQRKVMFAHLRHDTMMACAPPPEQDKKMPS